jgi:hypothetical protein
MLGLTARRLQWPALRGAQRHLLTTTRRAWNSPKMNKQTPIKTYAGPAVGFDDEVCVGFGSVDLRYTWKNDKSFYWGAFGIGVASCCTTVAVSAGLMDCLGLPFSSTFCWGIFSNTFAHELGHAEAARRFGVTVDAIFVWPLSGLCCSAMPKNAYENAVIALAGPAAGCAHAALYGLAGIAFQNPELSSVCFWATIFNLADLAPFESKDGLKSDGQAVLDGIVKKQVSANEWFQYGNDFPSDFYNLSNQQRSKLEMSLLGIPGIHIFVVGSMFG